MDSSSSQPTPLPSLPRTPVEPESALCGPDLSIFYLCQQLGATFCQIPLAHLISKNPKSGFHGQSPACSKGWEQVSATLVTFHLSSFLLFLLYSCPMASWSPCDPSQTFRPSLDISPLGLLCLLPSSPLGCYLRNSLNFQESKGPHRQNLSRAHLRLSRIRHVISPFCTSVCSHVQCLSLSGVENIQGGQPSRALGTVPSTS